MITLLSGIYYLLSLYSDRFAISRELNIFLEDIAKTVFMYAFIRGVDQADKVRGN
jgi:hypothetical protein